MPATAEPIATETSVVIPESAPAGTTPLAGKWREGMEKHKAAIAQPEPKPPAEKPVAKATEKTEKEVAPAKAVAKTKPVSALDAALGEVAPAKSEGAPPDDDAAAFDEKTPDWKRAREVMGAQSAELKKLRAETAKASAPDPAIKTEIETLRRERDQLAAENAKARDAITALDVRYEPGHQAKFVAGKKDLISKAAAKLKSFGGNGDALSEALSLPEGRLRSGAVKEAMGDIDPDDRLKVVAAIERIEALEEEEAAILKDPQQAWEQMSQKAQEAAQRAHEEAEKNKQAIFERVLKTLPEKHKLLGLVDSTVEGAENWNQEIINGREYAQHLIGPNASQEEISIAANKAARYDFVERLLLSERKESRERIGQLEEQLAKFEASEPGFRGTPKTPSAEYKTPAEKYREGMARRQEAAGV